MRWYRRARVTLCAAIVCVNAPTANAQRPQAVAPDSLVPALESAQSAYLGLWRSGWLQSEAQRNRGTTWIPTNRFAFKRRPDGSALDSRGFTGPDTGLFTQFYPERRWDAMHCGISRRDTAAAAESEDGTRPSRAWGMGWSISSRVTGYNACPAWYQGPARIVPWDERVDPDAPLLPMFRSSVQGARARLINVLQRVVQADPSNKWPIGQLVRGLIDQGTTDAADSALDSCIADAWWCELLRGYVSAANAARAPNADTAESHAFRAEQHYRRGLASMPADTRCQLTDIGELFEPVLRARYAHMPCTERDSVNAQVWWLADPLWSDTGNSRFSEQMTRAMLLQLKMGLSHDERFDWRITSGSDARVELVRRYGWPAFVYWGGPFNDSLMTYYLSMKGSPPNAPYATYEYGQGRMHVFPSAQAMANPLAAVPEDWQLVAPSGGDTIIHFKIAETYRMTDLSSDAMSKHARNSKDTNIWLREVYPRYVQKTLWWPVEHYAAPRGVVQLPVPAVAFLRRQDHAILATSVTLGSELGRTRDSMIDGITLVVTSRPDSFAFPARARGAVGSPVVLVGNIRPENALLGIEVPGATGGASPAARTRFGIAPPPALSAMRSDERALSDIVLLSPPAATAALPSSTNEALALMAPTETIRRGSSIGLYWESYGFGPRDSVTIEVRVQRTSKQGALRTLGRAMGLADDLNAPVLLRWTESDAAAGRTIIDGPVPVIGRAVRVNTARLPSGDYLLEVRVLSARGAPVRSQRSFSVQ